MKPDTRKYKKSIKNKYTRKRTPNKPNITFKKNDYRSSDGMVTKIWGPALWHSLHTISFNYPVHPSLEDKKNYRHFILNLQYVLPCKYCRINLKNNFKKLPLRMSNMKNRDTFSRYIYDLHELINEMLGKKSGLTYQDVRERYEHFRSRCFQDNKKDLKDMNLIKTVRFNKTVKKRGKEKGCTEPLYGKKAKCIIKIVPQEDKHSTFHVDQKCLKKKI
jgi:hypothetical protein